MKSTLTIKYLLLLAKIANLVQKILFKLNSKESVLYYVYLIWMHNWADRLTFFNMHRALYSSLVDDTNDAELITAPGVVF